MQKLIVVRHGEYEGRQLTEQGRNQIAKLAPKLKARVEGATFIILASTSIRGQQSAEILAEHLGGEPELHEVLSSEPDHPHNHEALLELIKLRQNEADVLILVTHYEYAHGFPSYYAEKAFGENLQHHTVGNGQAVVLHCETRHTELIS